MSARWQKISARIDAMSLRERAMLLAIVVLLLWSIWQLLLMAPLGERRRTQADQIVALRSQVKALNDAVQAMAAETGKDPKAAAEAKLAALQAQQAQVEQQLQQATAALVAPREMNQVLASIVEQRPGLQLVGLTSVEPEAIDLGSEGIAPLYKHGLQLTVDGDYLALLDFVRSLEGLPWQFIWGGLRIERQPDSPRSRLQLTLYTLSLSEGWLGV